MASVSGVGFNKAFLYMRESQKSLTDSLVRLSSGKRINKAADDASGMAIAASLESQFLGLGQSIRNAVDAVSITQVADGALEESAGLVMAIREKALQAANDSQSFASRQALQADINKALSALNGIAQNTSYNGQNLFSGQFTNKAFQIGISSGETVALNIGQASPDILGNADGSLTDINVLTSEGASQALSIADAALADINGIRGEIGSVQNQLVSTMNNLTLTRINVAAGESQVSDLDFAEESINFAKMKVLGKASAFAAVQTGNMNKQSMMDLLQG
ncbi:MAG: flagellin [Pseudomonadota bacterium]